MKRSFFLFLFLLVAQFAGAQDKINNEKITYAKLPIPVGSSPTNDPDLKNMLWDYWRTKNFGVASLDYDQGIYVSQHIEYIKAWVFSRWGLPNVDFQSECIICCVPNKELMKRLFQLDGSYAEVSRDSSGRITKSKIWLVLDGSPAGTIPPALTLVCLKEFEQTTNIKLNLWVYRGMAILNGTGPQIRSSLAPLGSSKGKTFNIDRILNTDEAGWEKFSKEQQTVFDNESAALCLLLRKEFGQANFLRFLKNGSSEESVLEAFRFNSYQDLDLTFKRYMLYLSQDVVSNRTPEEYLQITSVRR